MFVYLLCDVAVECVQEPTPIVQFRRLHRDGQGRYNTPWIRKSKWIQAVKRPAIAEMLTKMRLTTRLLQKERNTLVGIPTLTQFPQV